MGVSDFHDFDDEFNPLGDGERAQLGLRSNRAAFVRSIEDIDNENIFREALDAFFLTGALKLFRASKSAKAVSIRHHTMLVHRATSQDAHEGDRELVTKLLRQNAYHKAATSKRLWELWEKDFKPVSVVREPKLARPTSLEDLEPFIGEAYERFQNAKKQVLIVNGRDKNRDDMPDFDKESVWNILVGGAKLSRGYTVEGLTITYFLRKAAAADTLMQMGRWFGFRRGYRDLVRVYMAQKVADGRKKTVDLYELFQSVCMDEERFRRRIQIYSEEGIRPIEVPPLVPMGMLVPTQKNKMYNAKIEMENFGGRVAESGRTPFKPSDRSFNVERLRDLRGSLRLEDVNLSGLNEEGELRTLIGSIFEVDPASFLKFAGAYRWGTKESQFSSVVGFLQGMGDESPSIDSWLVAILGNPSAQRSWTFGDRAHGAFSRGVVEQRFNVFSESRHRDVAKHLCQLHQLRSPSSSLEALSKPRQAVCLIYPTIPNDGSSGSGELKNTEITIGLSLMFPKNNIRQKINYRVSDNSRGAPAFIAST